MVSYTELIQLGILIVGIISLFIQANKKCVFVIVDCCFLSRTLWKKRGVTLPHQLIRAALRPAGSPEAPTPFQRCDPQCRIHAKACDCCYATRAVCELLQDADVTTRRDDCGFVYAIMLVITSRKIDNNEGSRYYIFIMSMQRYY